MTLTAFCMKINSTKEIHKDKLFICIYGLSGMGKTSTIKALPAPPERVLILNTDNGLKVLRGTEFSYVDICRDDNGRLLDKKAKYERLEQFMDYVQTDEAKSKFDWVFIDSMSACSDIIDDACREQFVGFERWNEYKDSVVAFINFFQQLKLYDVVCTSLETTVDKGTDKVMPSVVGKSVKEVFLSKFDEVWRLVKVDGQRVFVCQDTPITQAKTRHNLNLTEPANTTEEQSAVFLKLKQE